MSQSSENKYLSYDRVIERTSFKISGNNTFTLIEFKYVFKIQTNIQIFIKMVDIESPKKEIYWHSAVKII